MGSWGCGKAVGRVMVAFTLGWVTPSPASFDTDDEVGELTETWIAASEIVRDLNELPVSGQSDFPYWSGDYWRTRWGLTSYRYSDGTKFKTYEAAVAAYEQPTEWLKWLPQINSPEGIDEINRWSPSEKYDLITGSDRFALTREQKNEGAELIGEDGKVEDWYGLCHGWAPAAIFTPAAEEPVTAVGISGAPVTLYPHDIRALVALAWTNGDYDVSFGGSRCDEEKPQRHRNGRVKREECFDTNPATLHLALANFLGNHSQAFLMDYKFDSEISNQPIIAYRMHYFNPLSPDVTDTQWDSVAVPYDDTFKESDPFQTPLTRGVRKGKKFDDRRVEKIVGVAVTITYLDEADAVFGTATIPNEKVDVTFTYDLEIENRKGVWIPAGGEWHTKNHPDFLWMVHKGQFPQLPADKSSAKFSLTSAPDEEIKAAAEKASKTDAYPLCQIVKALVEASSGRNYPCGL